MQNGCIKFLCSITILMLMLASCSDNHPAEKPVIVMTPEQMDDEVASNIQAVLQFAVDHDGQINDSVKLRLPGLVLDFYKKSEYKNVWSRKEQKQRLADSLLRFIDSSRLYGLFPKQYHKQELEDLHWKFSSDSLAIKDATAWTKLDLLSTDAFFSLLKDLKESRTREDSVSIINKPFYIDSFFLAKLHTLLQDNRLTETLESAEPDFFKYKELRYAVKNFVEEMDTTKYLEIDYPYDDSLAFVKSVYQRLLQSGIGDSEISLPDSAAFARAVKAFQKSHNLTADGKPGAATVRKMNETDIDRFKRIAATLDRYKSMSTPPGSFVWVNIPSFGLEVWQGDSLVLQSKVIVGKITTPTPELVSNINNMVTFPNWTIPASIIKKDILPQLKTDPGYLARKGYNLYKENGEIVDPFSIDWSKYKNGIPWKVVQGSGDDNALGIFKFNFHNPYDVYLHDTNQRYLFSNSNRALSHGCVRVQKWKALADYIADRDSSLMKESIPLPYTKDSIQNWIRNRDRKSIMVKNKLPVYIAYFTCEAKDGRIIFFDDIYGKDAALLKKYYN